MRNARNNEPEPEPLQEPEPEPASGPSGLRLLQQAYLEAEALGFPGSCTAEVQQAALAAEAITQAIARLENLALEARHPYLQRPVYRTGMSTISEEQPS